MKTSLRPGRRSSPAAQPRVDRQPVERDVVDVDQKSLGVDAVVPHQPRHRRAMVVEILLLHAPRLDRVDIEQPHDEGAHALVDQVEQLRRRRIERVVEIEDPAVDMVEARRHVAALTGCVGPGQAARFTPPPQSALTRIVYEQGCTMKPTNFLPLLLAGAVIASPAVAQPASRTVIHAGHLLAEPGKPARGASTIIVENGRIVAVADGYQPAEPGATLIDLKDKYVLPGLIDSHVHLTSDAGGSPGSSRM